MPTGGGTPLVLPVMFLARRRVTICHEGHSESRGKDGGGEGCRRLEGRGGFEEKKKGLGHTARPQRRGEFPSEPAASSGPAGQVLPPACELLGIDGKETLLAWPQRQMRVHWELGGVESSAGQVLPPACTVLSWGSP